MVSVLGRFFVLGRGSPLLVGALPFEWGVMVVSLDISRSVPDD